MNQAKVTSLTEINIGFMPLIDCAPIVIAQEKGFFESFNLNVSLKKQSSWATMRDKLHAGVLDGAQFLAPMPIASTLGLGCASVEVIAPLILSQNGNGITLSTTLYEEIKFVNQLKNLDIPLSAALLKGVINQRKKIGKKLVFATVYPYSCHYYQLTSWFLQNNIAIEDIDIKVIPPANMVDALACEDIDGFCVGGPWNAKAVRDGIGVTVLTSCDIWPDMPEKVLAFKRDWYEQNPETTLALISALYQACQWLESVANRFEAARLLAQHHYLDLPLSVIAPSLIGSCLIRQGESPRDVPKYNRFSSAGADNINKPELFHGEWLLNQMRQHKHIAPDTDIEQVIKQVYRQDIFEQAMLNHQVQHQVSTVLAL